MDFFSFYYYFTPGMSQQMCQGSVSQKESLESFLVSRILFFFFKEFLILFNKLEVREDFLVGEVCCEI